MQKKSLSNVLICWLWFSSSGLMVEQNEEFENYSLDKIVHSTRQSD